MGEWREVTLGDVLTLQRGFDITKKQQRPGSIPVVSSSGISSYHDDARAEGPGVVIGRKGSLGTAFYLSGPYWPHDTTLWVKDFKGNDPYYCYLLLKSLRLDELDSGAANPTLNRNHVHRLDVRVPPIAQQCKISAVLGAFDDLIAVSERRVVLLEHVVSWVYHEWFARFRFPNHRRSTVKRSPLGLIPRDWDVVRLSDIVDLRYGKALPAKARRPGRVAVVSSAGVIGEHDQALVEGPGVVVGRKGNVGSIWWIDGPFFPIDTTYYVETELPLGLVYWQLRNLSFIDSHAAIPGLSRDQANRLLLVCPPRALARQFDSLHRTCFAAIANLRKSSRRLVATRDLLLPRLVSGRLDISDVDLGTLTPTPEAA